MHAEKSTWKPGKPIAVGEPTELSLGCEACVQTACREQQYQQPQKTVSSVLPSSIFNLVDREDPCCYATHVVGLEHSAHPTQKPAEQLSSPVDMTNEVSSPSWQLQHSDRNASLSTLLNFPPISSTCLQLRDIPHVWKLHIEASHSPGAVHTGRWKSTGSAAGSCWHVGGQLAFFCKSFFPSP